MSCYGARREVPTRWAPQVERAWCEARATVPGRVAMRDPADLPTLETVGCHDGLSRRIYLNLELCERLGILDCLPSILVHELGHHLHHPRQMARQARHFFLMRRIVRRGSHRLLNVFYDLLIDGSLRDQHRRQMVRVMRALVDDGVPALTPQNGFFLAMYEALWSLPQGTLLDPDLELVLAAHREGYRAEAAALVRHLPNLGPNSFSQLILFLSVYRNYLTESPEGTALGDSGLGGCSGAEPQLEDWAQALVPDPQEAEAIDQAEASGQIGPRMAARLRKDLDPGQRLDAFARHVDARRSTRQQLAGMHYRSLARAHLVALPRRAAPSEASLPTGLLEWSPGDALGRVDWRASFIRRGRRWAVAAPLMRDLLAEEEGPDTVGELPRVEIWLDVSGSMPDPASQVNAMTLAAVILAQAALRDGGSARAVLYSDRTEAMPGWSRDQAELESFLAGYLGQGTWFPFQDLARSVAEHAARPPTRVLISDQDFHHNFDAAAEHRRILADAARGSAPLILLLHLPEPGPWARYQGLGAQVVRVRDLLGLPRAAAQLAASLLGGGR